MSSATADPPPVPGEPSHDELAIWREMPIFGAVPDAALDLLRARGERVEVPGGHWFFRQGDRGESMYVLRSGLVEVRRTLGGRFESLGRLGPGDCFGEMALIDHYPRSADVRAVEDCVALSIGSGLLYELYQCDPETFTLIMMNLARELSRRLRRAEAQLFLRREPDRIGIPRGRSLGEIPYV